MSETITLAHVSDVHLSPAPGVALRHLNVKRGLGYLNWQRQRRRTHNRAALDLVSPTCCAQARSYRHHRRSDQSWDCRSEYEAATAWLHEVGTPHHVTVVPGNHDIYSALRDDPGVEPWADYMRADAFGAKFDSSPPAQFPFVRRVGPIALIGLNSAVETPPFVAAGEVGKAQLDALDELLPQLEAEGLVRVVLIHHPPLPGQAPPRRALRDAARVVGHPGARGAELVLHGHNHRDMSH